MQLLDLAVGIKQCALQGDFPAQMIEVVIGAVVVLGNHLGAGTVKTHRVAERDVEVQRQWPRNRVLVTVLCPQAVIVFRYTLVKLGRSRIGGIARPRLVIAPDQVGIKFNVLGHYVFTDSLTIIIS